MLNIKVDFLPETKIDEAAMGLLRKFAAAMGTVVQPPIPIDDIVEKYLGLTVEVEDLRGRLRVPDVLGATWIKQRLVRVEQTIEKQEGRLAFTLAHETGHWILHRPIYEREHATLSLFGPAAEDPEPFVCRDEEKFVPIEAQANKFAARLLAPAEFVRAAVRELHGQDVLRLEGVRRSHDAGQVDDRFRSLAAAVITQGKFTNFSNEAMRYRLLELNVVRDADGVPPKLV